MISRPNQQYNVAPPDSLAVRVAARMRAKMFDTFMQMVSPHPGETVLDVGVTSDQTYGHSNYFEALYPWKDRITAAGLDDAAFLEEQYPGVKFVRANALQLPFESASFDLLHSAAVLEHVGALENQARMVAECLRVARRAVCLTTPNRWFPIEFHTRLPLVHWLPKPLGRAIFRRVGLDFFALEENLNLMHQSELARLAGQHPGWKCIFRNPRLCGWVSNLVLIAFRNPSG